MDLSDARQRDRQRTIGQPEGWTDKVWREIALVGQGVTGFGHAAEGALDHPLETGTKVAISTALGFGLGLACRRAGVLGLAGRAVGASLGLSFLSDLGHYSSSMATALSDNWDSSKNWNSNVALMKDSVGRFTFDTVLMSAGALSGGLLSGRVFEVKPRLSASEAGTFSHLLSELRARGLTEQQIVNSAKPENLLGMGNASVYRIPLLDNFVAKVPSRFGPAVPGTTLEPLADILPGSNIGQPIARLGDWTILKRQSGVPAGGPLYRERMKIGDEAANTIYLQRVRAAAEMPQSAYDDFAATLKLLDGRGLRFDPSKAGNVLIDVAGSAFNVVDISPAHPQSTYHHSVSDMVITLMDNGSAWRIPKSPALQAQYQAIVEKSLKAAQSTGLPTGNGGSSFDYSLQLAGLNAK